MKLIDDFLNNITMYRLVLYFLILLAVGGLVFSVFGGLPFDPLAYTFSFTFILTVSYIANKVFAKTFEAPTNVESVWITGLILGLIITPPTSLERVIFIGWAAILAMASKYIFAIGKKHIFNPVAIAVFLTATFIGGTASWWVGTSAMLPIVAVAGFLIIRKIRRWDLALSFLATSIVTIGAAGMLRGENPLSLLQTTIVESPLLFFTSVMLTEPLTTPPTRNLRILYGAVVGFLFAPQVHFGGFYTTPEIALIIGNIYSYIVSPKLKLTLNLKRRIQIAPDIFDFVFAPGSAINFTPGQYMEFTLEHPEPDDRGVRRYLSLASSPTESDIRLGIKFGNPPSSYKRNLFNLTPAQKVVAGQLIGDFIMPKDASKKLVFIAGGIGITPYRSMLKYLIDKNQKRDIKVFYAAKSPKEFVYKDVLDEAERRLGIKTFYVVSEESGHLNQNMIREDVPDYRDRYFYISGSHSMVSAFESILKKMGIPSGRIVTDYFPGFV